jgi:hypothetical protein
VGAVEGVMVVVLVALVVLVVLLFMEKSRGVSMWPWRLTLR